MSDRTFAGASVEPHRPTLLRFAATLVAANDVEDLVQDALTRAWQKRGAFDPDRGTLRAWLLAIVADQARTRWRRRELTQNVELRETPTPDTGSDARLDVRKAVDELTARQRAVVVLFYYVDLSVGEVAAVLDCSEGTVKSTLHDARRSLSNLLGSPYVGD